MKDKNKRLLWKILVDKYIDIIGSDDEIWMNNYEKLKKFIETCNKRPNKRSEDDNIKKLGGWDANQRHNYKDNNGSMNKETQPVQRALFTELMRSYQHLFPDIILDE